MAESNNVYILITSISQHNPVLLTIVDLDQYSPPAQQFLDAHLEKLFAYQTSVLAIESIPTLLLTAQQ